MGKLSIIRCKQDTSINIILVHSLSNQQLEGLDAFCDYTRHKKRLSEQHAEARLMVYEYEDLSPWASPITTVNKEARSLLSDLDMLDLEDGTCLPKNILEAQAKRVDGATRPILFICQGFAGLVVQKTILLAKSRSNSSSIVRRTFGMIFLGTPHISSTKIHTDRPFTSMAVQDRDDPSCRDKLALKYSTGVAKIMDEFTNMSSLFSINYFCKDDERDCSGGNILHLDCLWSKISSNHMSWGRDNHYLIPRTSTADLPRAVIERAAISMSNAAVANRQAGPNILGSELAFKSIYTQERLPSTCEWILTHPAFVEWTAFGGPACLWINGSPGSGKSILFSAIIDYLLEHQQPKNVTVFSFLEEGLGRNDVAQHLLRTLIYQLSACGTVSESFPASILSRLQSQEAQMSRQAFQHLLRTIFASIDWQTRIFLVLDGLEKYDWVKSAVVDEIISANSTRGSANIFKCAISSRESCDHTSFNGIVRRIHINRELGAQRDVIRFAEVKLADLVLKTTKENICLTALARKIFFRGQGLFLWVSLVIERLQHTESSAQLEKEIDCLPQTLDGLYRRALRNVPSQNTKIARKIFSWLIAARRPLQLLELLEALKIEADPQMKLANSDIASIVRNMKVPELEIPQICSSLVVVTKEKTVMLRHASVRNYLLSSSESSLCENTLIEAHILLAQTCLTLMTPREKTTSPVPCSDTQPLQAELVKPAGLLTDYVTNNWLAHYRMAEPHNKDLTSKFQRSLTTTLHHNCESFSLSASRKSVQIATTSLRLCAYYGIVSLTRVLLEMGIHPDADSCSHCETPLALAAANDHSEAAALLLQKGASTTASPSGSGETALHLAAAYGALETTRLLLKYGADADTTTKKSGKTPLHAAAASGHVEIIKLLVEHGADVNAVTWTSRDTPLYLAAYHGHLQAVNCLSDGLSASEHEVELYDAIVDQQYYHSWTQSVLTNRQKSEQLIWEVEAKRFAEEDIRRLCSPSKRYVDIHKCTREGWTPLHGAASNGHEAIVRFFLEKGADLHAAGSGRSTPLRMAAENGQLATVQLLLAEGADVSTDFFEIGATLQSVIDKGHDKVADLLLWYSFIAKVAVSRCQQPVLVLAAKGRKKIVRSAMQKKGQLDGVAGRESWRRVPYHD